MDNFRKFQQPKKPNNSSVDGLMPSAGGQLKPKAAPPLSYTDKPAPTAGQMSEFKRPDGFHPAQQTTLEATPNPAAEIAGSEAFSRYRNLSPQGPAAQEAAAKPKKQKRSLGKIFKRVGFGMAILVLATGLYFGVKVYFAGKNILKGGASAPALAKTVDISKLNGEGDGRVNILLLGKGGDNHPGGQLTDTMLLLSIDPIQKEAAIVSIPRDLYVKIAGTSSYMKLNAAYAMGKENSRSKDPNQQEADGVNKLYDTLSPILGIPIHYYVMFDFTAYKNVVDTVGGVDVHLDNAIYDPNFDWQYGHNALKLPAGNNHLNGTQALLLGRSRGAHGGYGVATDFDRNSNQRKMLISLKGKIMSAGTYSNPVKVNQIITQLGSHVHTSFGSLEELKRLQQIMATIPSSNITSLDFVTPPHAFLTTGNIAGQSVVLPKAGQGNYHELQSFVRNTLKDSFLKQESATVAVYNATSKAGLAASKADDLRSYGYIVTTVANAPDKGITKTVVVDLSKGQKKYTKHYLEQRYKTTAVTTIPDAKITPGNVDFVIILGQDVAGSP